MLARVVEELERHGLLLESDPTLPSVVTLVAGGPVKGSWWGHPKGHEIFRVSRQLAEHDDALLCKLLSGKLTYVHRRLWPALVTVGRARAPWQTEGLPRGALRALDQVEKVGSLPADELRIPKDAYDRKKAVQALESRMLVYTRTVHTQSGAHARVLESWNACAARLGINELETSLEGSQRELEAATHALNEAYRAKARLPWQGLSPGR